MAGYLQRLGIRLSLKLAISSIVVTALIIIISAALIIALIGAGNSISRIEQIDSAIAASTRLNFALNDTIDANVRLQQLDKPSVNDRTEYYAARKPLLDARHELQDLSKNELSGDWATLDTRLSQLITTLDRIADTAPENIIAARDLWNTTAFDLSNEVKGRAAQFNDAVLRDARNTRESAQAGQNAATIILIILAVIAVLVSILFGILNNAVFVRPIRSIEYELKRIAAGDLTHQLRVDNNDELGDLVRTFNITIAELRGIITELKHQTGDIEGASAQVTSITRQQLDGSKAQVEALDSATRLIADLKEAARSIDRSALMVASAAKQALTSAASGSESINANIRSMQQIQDKVVNINAQVNALSEGLTQVGRILELMDDLASDSEILSLNALIEASGAGPNSRRFAVVAGEMSDLAQRSKDATKEVQQIIYSVQEAMSSSLQATQDGLREVALGTELSRRSESATRQIVDAVSNTATLASSILSSTTRQQTASEQAARTILTVNQVAASNLDTSSKVASTASRLTVIANQLRDAAGNFEVN